MYKLGVTSKNKSGTLAGVTTTVLLEEELPYEEALRIEHQLHTELEDQRYFGQKKLLRNGNTELYKTNIINHISEKLNRRAS